MERRSLLIQQKINQWPSSCCLWSYPASVKHPRVPACQSPKKPECRGAEAGRVGGAPTARSSPPPPLRRGSRQEAVTQKIINISHFLCQFSSKNTPVRLRFTPPPLRSQGAMQIQAPPFFFFFFLFYFVFLPHTPNLLF